MYIYHVTKDLLKTIQGAIDKLNADIPYVQEYALNELIDLTKGLDTRGGVIVPSVKNLSLVSKIRGKMDAIVLTKSYKGAVSDFLAEYNQVAVIQNEYFHELTDEFTPNKVLKEIQVQAVEDAANSLTEAGVNSAVVDPIKQVLSRNINGGGSYSGLVKQMTELLTDTESSEGLLTKHVKQITTDGLNQYSRQYTQIISSDLGLNKFSYDGAIIKTSRCFCRSMVGIRYFTTEDIPDMLRGKFKGMDCPLYDSTGLPYGLIDGTDAGNFLTYLGGWGCGHVAVPVL